MINGICPCGGNLKDSRHTVHTLRTAIEWDPSVTKDDLPIIVEQRRCQDCVKLIHFRILKSDPMVLGAA